MIFVIDEIPPGATPAEASALARQALARLVKAHYSISPLPDIEVLPSGKPVFADRDDIHFSLSHCRRAVMAVVDSHPVGCDIEDIVEGEWEDMLQIAFNDSERRQIRSARIHAPGAAEPNDSREALTAIWTRKEAIVKRRGDIPDNPADWPSFGPGLITRIIRRRGYAFSIATTASRVQGNFSGKFGYIGGNV